MWGSRHREREKNLEKQKGAERRAQRSRLILTLIFPLEFLTEHFPWNVFFMMKLPQPQPSKSDSRKQFPVIPTFCAQPGMLNNRGRSRAFPGWSSFIPEPPRLKERMEPIPPSGSGSSWQIPVPVCPHAAPDATG